jgi:tetratricopeptide (TPR) repeat protein
MDCRALEQAARQNPKSLRIAFQLGHVYGALGRFEDAKRQFVRAIAWAGHESRTYHALGYALGELGAWQAAAGAMLVAARADSGRLDSLGAFCECARRLALAGVPVPQQRRSVAGQDEKALTGKISVIVCSITPAKLHRLRSNLERLLFGEDWELVHIGDACSLCAGYNRGVLLAQGELLVFCHDDIEIFNSDFAAMLRKHLAVFDLIGVAGSTLATGPSWRWSGALYNFASVAHPRSDGDGLALSVCGTRGPVIESAQLLDGLFLAARRSLLERVSFDEITFDGFHFYDLDFSYRAWLSGARTAICRDIAIYHQSRGEFNVEHLRYAERFRLKFPKACSSPVSDKAKLAEILLDDSGHLEQIVNWLNHFLRQEKAQLKAAAV